MQQLTSNVFVDTQVKGCNFGFVTTSDGLVMIDSPHKPTDAMKLKAEIAQARPAALYHQYRTPRRSLDG